MPEQKFHIAQKPWSDSVELYFGILFENGDFGNAEPVKMTLRRSDDPTGNQREPMLVMNGRSSEAALQSLMDELWRVGVRPKDIGTAGHLAATQAHLNDFRAIVAKSLDVKLS